MYQRHTYLRILGRATLKEDTEQGFDAVLSFPDVKIPIRIRKHEYLKYMDLTIRSKSKYNNKTEIDKLKEGFGDYYFYAWTDETKTSKGNNNILTYMILDLSVFRNTVLENPSIKDKPNFDGTCFNTYTMKQLQDNGIVKVFEDFRSNHLKAS